MEGGEKEQRTPLALQLTSKRTVNSCTTQYNPLYLYYRIYIPATLCNKRMGGSVGKPILVAAGISAGVAGSCAAGYFARDYLKEDPLCVLVEDELQNVATKEGKPIEPEQAVKIVEVVHKYSKQYTKLNWRVNRVKRRTFFKANNYPKYIKTILNGFYDKRKVEERVRKIALNKLKISKETLEELMRKYKEEKLKHSVDVLEGLSTTEPLSTKKAQEVMYERRRLEMEVDLDNYVSKNMEEKCKKVIGEDWKEVIRKFIVDDMLHDSYNVTAKEAEEFLKESEHEHQPA
eukprot:TRINITY_DN3718_c0_g1_i7.p1 TRINITY_DN3718_c0_g1~~TRINITY_DN3718_c0_g1_i7.p1  ORF type:complete len:289 (+),score=83.56 TRINITY_DN3718_c0_g1_i7:1495-2361(+)